MRKAESHRLMGLSNENNWRGYMSNDCGEYCDLKIRVLKRSQWNGGCLESTYKPKSKSGYALVKYRRSTLGAHRASWMGHYGSIPPNMWVLHKCDNPICINPDHLFLGTAQDNTNDMISKRRHNYFGSKKYEESLVDNVINMRKTGATYKKIGEKYNLEIGQVQAIFMRPTRKEDVKEFFGVEKYSKEIRRQAHNLRSDGMKCKDIQKTLGIPKRSLTRIFKKGLDSETQ